MEYYQTELLDKFFKHYDNELPPDIIDYYKDYEERLKRIKETDNELEGHH